MTPPKQSNQDNSSDDDSGLDIFGGIKKLFSGIGGDGGGGGGLMLGLVVGLLVGLVTGNPMAGLMVGAAVAFGSSMLGGGDDSGQGSGFDFSSIAKALGLGGIAKALGLGGETSPSTAVAPEGHTVNTADNQEVTKRKNEIITTSLMAGALIDFDNPSPASPVAKADQQRVMEELSRLAPGTIKFYDDASGTYRAVTPNSPEAFQQAIRNDKSKRVSIDVVVNGQRETRYFQQVAYEGRESNASGFAGSACRETDSAGQFLDKTVWLNFPGYTGDAKKLMMGQTDGSAQSQSMLAILDGKLSPQLSDAATFASGVFDKFGPDFSYMEGSMSMGVANMHAAKIVADARHIPVKEIAVESFGDTHQVDVINAALASPQNEFGQTLARLLHVPENELAAFRQDFKGEDSLRSVFKDEQGKNHTTLVANAEIGIGLSGNIQNYLSGKGHPGEGNGMAGSSQRYVDISSLNLQHPEFEGHEASTIITALEKGNTVYEAGQTLNGSNVTVADASGAASQPGLPSGQGATRNGPGE